MMQMRPFQIILLSVFAVLAVIGLYVFSTFSGFGTTSNQVGSVVIWGTLPSDAMSTALSTLTHNHKEFQNVRYVEKNAQTIDSELANALASGTGPDAVIITQEQLESEIPKLENIPFSSISQRTFLNTYLAIDQLYLNQQGTYGVPLTVDPIVLYYNRSMLSSAGIATPPATWEAMTGLAPVLTKTSGQTITKSAISFGSYTNVTNARAILSLLFLQAGSAITQTTQTGIQSVLSAQNTGVTGETPAAAAVNFFTQFANPAKTVYSWNASLPASRQEFIAGDLAFYVGYASEEASLRAANPNLDFDMAPVPQSGVGNLRKTYGLAYAFAIPKVAVNKNGAYSAALGITASDVLPQLALSLGMAPAQRTMLGTNPANPFTAVYYPEALNATGWLSPAPAAVDAIFAAMISNVITGRYEVPQALNAADQSLNAAL
jgi:ABC-type glycerol-3-phosphate transport system substrate-binding protein